MKKVLFFQKMTFHELTSGKITTKLHCEIFGIVFRVKLGSYQPKRDDHREWLGLTREKCKAI